MYPKSYIMKIFWGILFLIGLVSCTSDPQLGSAGKQLQATDGSVVNIPSGAMGAVRVLKAGTADPDELLFEGQGYFHASQRLLQMDILRRIAQGRLSELLGSKAYKKDEFSYAIGLPLSVEKSYQKLLPLNETRRLIEAFARGVNRYIKNLETENPALFKQYKERFHSLPSQWTMKDSVSVGTSMSYLLSGQLENKLVLSAIWFQFRLTVGAEKFYEMVRPLPVEPDSVTGKFYPLELLDPKAPDKRVAPLPASAMIDDSSNKKPAQIEPLDRMIDEVEDVKEKKDETLKTIYKFFNEFSCNKANEYLFEFPVQSACKGSAVPGSNNWVVSNHKQGKKNVLLAGDPHLAITFPSTFIENCLVSKDAGGTFKVCGMTPPGAPGVLIGHNDEMGWAITNHPADVDDLYIEKLETENIPDTDSVREQEFMGKKVPVLYAMVAGKRVKVQREQVDIKVRQSDGSLEVRSVELKHVPGHGPLFSEYRPEIKEYLTPLDLSASYRWSGHEGSTELHSLLLLNRAQNFNEFKGALSFFEVGSQHFVYGDKKGNIGYFSPAKYPVRDYLSKAQPPYVAVQSSYVNKEWKGYHQNQPELYNPDDQFIISANNNPYEFRSFELQEGEAEAFGEKVSEQQKRRSLSYLGFRYDLGSRAKRIRQLIEAKRTERNVLTVKDMQDIQFDHRDLFAERYVDLVKKFKADIAEELQGDATALSYLNEFLTWGENAQVKRHLSEPIHFYTWLAQLQVHFYRGEYFEENNNPFGNEMFNLYLKNALANTSMYTNLLKAIEADADPEFKKKVASYMAKSLIDLDSVLDNRNALGKVWGDVHQFQPFNMLKGIIPSLNQVPLSRDGSLTTVDVAGFRIDNFFEEDTNLDLSHFYGANFRMVLSIGPEGITGRNILPGGAGKGLDSKNYDELIKWRAGESRRMIGFED